MKNSKLLDLLKTFSKQELRAFGDYLRSPYFNKNEELVRFYQYLRMQAPKFPDKKIHREVVFEALYPGQPYDDKQCKYLMSFLLKQAEGFLGLRRYETQFMEPELHQLETFQERQLAKHFNHAFSRTAEQMKAHPYRDAEFFQKKHRLQRQAVAQQNARNIRRINEELQHLADTFDQYYLAQKLKYTCAMLNMQKFLSADYQQNLTDEISHYLRHKKYDDLPAIALYYQIFLTLTEEQEESHFYKLIELLNQHALLFPPAEIKELYLHAVNYCSRKIREQKERFVEQALQLYSKGIEEGFLLDHGQLSPWTYKNVLKLGLRLRRYEWTTQFIQTYQKALSPEFRENAVNYGLADLHYHKEDMDRAMIHLREVAFTDVFFTLDAKVMLAKIYYEQNEWEALHSLLASFRIYLKRNKLISNSVRITYLNFITIVNGFLKDHKAPWKILRRKIDQMPLLTDRKWLREVVERRS